MKTAEIVTLGDELTTGKTPDTNAAHIAAYLFRRGWRVRRIASVGDDTRAIQTAVRQAMKQADLVVVTGGLGPTHDDITKYAICKLFKSLCRLDKAVLKQIERFFVRRGRSMPKVCYDYAQIPVDAVAVENRFGVAPGLFFQNRVMVLPGVPYEMENMLKTSAGKLIPDGGGQLRETLLRTADIGETKLVEKITGLQRAMKTARIAFYPQGGHVDIRIVSCEATAKKAENNLQRATDEITKNIAQHLWATGDKEIEQVVGALLKRKKKTLAVAESCTGGGIGHALTNVAGSSGYFLGGTIAYNDAVKVRQLGVPKALLAKHGAVSRETAVAMARGAKKAFRADYALAITGIAGPGGGTKDKPVGLVYLALAGPRKTIHKKLLLGDERGQNRVRSIFEALYFLYRALKGLS